MPGRFPRPHVPLFTVVMPAYRAATTIRTAIASVLAQTETRFELIVVDDGSPDDSAAQARALAAGDSRIIVMSQHNAGPAAARNNGVALGTAPFIAFLDADDRWASQHLQAHLAHFAAHPEMGVSFGRICFHDPSLTRPGRVSSHVPYLELPQALGENAVCTTSNLVTRRAVFQQIGGFDTAMTHAEDQEWVARVLATTGWSARGLDTILVDYRTSIDGLSADLDRMREGWRLMVERVHRHAPARVTAAEPKARALFERYLARRALRTGQPAARALSHLAAGLRSSPMALFTHAPKRTLLTVAGALASAALPAAFVRAAITR